MVGSNPLKAIVSRNSKATHFVGHRDVHVYTFTLSATVVLTRLAFKWRYDVLSKAPTLIM
jgi:hypothetical protein